MRDRLAMNYSLEAISQARAAGRECHLIMSDVAKKAYEYADAMLAERGAK